MSKGKLYFRNNKNCRAVVKESLELEEVFKEMWAYLGAKYPGFELPHYVRAWKEDNVTTYDFGSWSEFFEFEED